MTPTQYGQNIIISEYWRAFVRKVCEFSNVPPKFQGCDSIALPCYFCLFKVSSLSNLPCGYSCINSLFSFILRDAPYPKVVESQTICT